MKRRTPPKDLTKAIEAGHQPMFMTGTEIMRNYRVNPSDIQENEYSTDTWQRKLKEAKMTGEERYGKDAFEPGRSLMYRDLRHHGIQPQESLESITKKKGAPEGFVSLGQHEILGGHHRVALSNEQFKTHLFPVKYFSDIVEAKNEPGYK